MNKKKRNIIIISAIGFALLIGVLVSILIIDAELKEKEQVQRQTEKIKQEWYSAIEAAADGQDKFLLYDTTPFEWDEVYIASGYFLESELAEQLGEKSKEIFSDDAKPILMGLDLYTLWLFFFEDKLVFELGGFDIHSPGERVKRVSKEAYVTVEISKKYDMIDVFDLLDLPCIFICRCIISHTCTSKSRSRAFHSFK